MVKRHASTASAAPAIGELALLGDTRTAALVDERGEVVWLCLPHFDGEPVFASLIAGAGGGSFTVGPAGHAEVISRGYRRGSPVLETTWRVGGSSLVATEGMVSEIGGALFPTMCLVRRLEARGGPVACVVHFDPRTGVGRLPLRSRRTRQGVVCLHRDVALSIAIDDDLVLEPGRVSEVVVEPGRPLTIAVSAAHRGPLTHVSPAHAWSALIDDDRRWREWAAEIDFSGLFADTVERSLITLRLLTYSPSGAPVAAPTTSLPEVLGGGRNWDYRYAWPRDASIGIGAFLGVGRDEQARAFLYWLLHASRLDRPRLPALLTLHGRPAPAEREAGWPGYGGSRPVRFGNAAAGQHQLDNYGWVVDAMWLLVDHGHRLYGETWRAGRGLAGFVADHWHEPDAGLWEGRDSGRHYVHSKLMAWLALDRALRIATTHGASDRERARWTAARDAIAADLAARGIDHARGVYVRSYGDRDLDAALLLLPLIGIEPPRSPRVRATIDAICDELTAGGPLLYRYPPRADGLAGDEGAFLPCSFWLAQALAATGRLDEAVEVFEQLIGCASGVGLFAEEIDPTTGALLGNYPQAFTHASLVQAALAIEVARRDRAAAPAQRRTRRGRSS